MPRLGSKKSRNGCQQCKRRRVKCDEQRPCASCVKYGFDCSLLNTQQLLVETHSPNQNRASSQATTANPTSASPSDSVSSPPCPSCGSGAEDRTNPLWMHDLELMHHYTADAHLSMPGVDQARQAWGYSVPQEAFQHPFLMHCLLAFSAYHLAYLNPASRPHYRVLASTHQACGLAAINKVLPVVDESNCHALFAAASLITLNAFADSDIASVDALLDIFHLLKGMDAVLESTEPLVHNGPFAPILRVLSDPPNPPPGLLAYLADLQSAANTLHSNPEQTQAIIDLRDSLQHGLENSSHPALRAVMYWPIKLRPGFIDMLREGKGKESMECYLKIMEYAATEWWFLASWRNVTGHRTSEAW